MDSLVFTERKFGGRIHKAVKFDGTVEQAESIIEWIGPHRASMYRDDKRQQTLVIKIKNQIGAVEGTWVVIDEESGEAFTTGADEVAAFLADDNGLKIYRASSQEGQQVEFVIFGGSERHAEMIQKWMARNGQTAKVVHTSEPQGEVFVLSNEWGAVYGNVVFKRGDRFEAWFQENFFEKHTVENE